MISAAVTFLTIGVADLIAGGLQGTPASKPRALIGIFGGSLIALIGGPFAASRSALLLAFWVNLVGVTSWLLLRASSRFDGRRAWLALAALTLHLGFGIGSAGLWTISSDTWIDRWLATLAFPALRNLDASLFLLIASQFVLLAATANGVVRTVLVAAGTNFQRSEQQLSGGRAIGLLERWMIFGLILSGAPTAAGFVVSAKSILRFPELARVAGSSQTDPSAPVQSVDYVTEYFLLGSLVSWLLAIGLGVLTAG